MKNMCITRWERFRSKISSGMMWLDPEWMASGLDSTVQDIFQKELGWIILLYPYLKVVVGPSDLELQGTKSSPVNLGGCWVDNHLLNIRTYWYGGKG